MSVPAAFIGVVVIWSTTPLAIKWSAEGSGFLFGVSSRMVIGLILCGLIMIVLRQKLPVNKQAIKAYMVSAMSLYAMMMLVYWSAQYVPSGIISIIYGLSPFATGLFASYWLGEKAFSTNKLMGMSIAFTGLLMIFGNAIHGSNLLLLGMLGVFLGMIIQSAVQVWLKPVIKDIPALAFNTGGLLIASICFVITWTIFSGQIPDDMSTKAMGSIVYLGIFGSVFGFILFFYILKNVDASRLSMITLVTPMLALELGNVLNHEVLQLKAVYGAGLIMSGLFLYEWKSLRKIFTRPAKEIAA